MRRQRVDVRAYSPADAATVYALLRDGTTWPLWSSIDAFELERPGADEPEGVGAIRVFVRGRVRGRDEITELTADRGFGYRNLSGLPLRDYFAAVSLQPGAGDGTAIRWQASFLPKVPGTGRLYRWGIERFLRQAAQGLAAYAAGRSSPS